MICHVSMVGHIVLVVHGCGFGCGCARVFHITVILHAIFHTAVVCHGVGRTLAFFSCKLINEKKIEYFRNLTLTIIDVIDIIGCYQGYRVPQSVPRGDQNSPRSSVQSATARAGLVEASESGAVAGQVQEAEPRSGNVIVELKFQDAALVRLDSSDCIRLVGWINAADVGEDAVHWMTKLAS